MALYDIPPGFPTGGRIRDTDECILQKISVLSKFILQPMDQARIRCVEKDIPIAIGGVAVYPGDPLSQIRRFGAYLYRKREICAVLTI